MRLLAIAVFLLMLVGACERHREPDAAIVPKGATPDATLEGVIRFSGSDIPASTLVENQTDPEACGTRHSLGDILVSEPTQGIANAIVALVDIPPEKIGSFDPSKLILDNTDCRFQPHVSVLTLGDTIEIRNSDPVLHTTHFYGALEANIALPFKGTWVTRAADRPGMVVVKCDVHGWMQAYIRIDDHPFHAVSDSEGRFQISDVPPGSYTFEAWHERLGLRRLSVDLSTGDTTHIVIDYAGPAPG